jgi:hypothetical protein
MELKLLLRYMIGIISVLNIVQFIYNQRSQRVEKLLFTAIYPLT